MPAVELRLDGEPRVITYDKLIMAGYTGRNQEEVAAHIEELRQHGIPAPDRVPTLFPCAPALLTFGGDIDVLGADTSGEAEYVLYVDDDEILVGTGSDHTDREFEAVDINRSKQLCAKVASRDVWRLTDVLPHWDELRLRGWVGANGAQPPTLYQDGPLARMLGPDDLLAYVRSRLPGPLGNAIVFSGTLPLLDGQFRPGSSFACELHDPHRDRALRCEYRVRSLDYLR